MFVRWKKKMRKDGENYMLTATLVENHRVDGKIQQKHLLHLSSLSTKPNHVYAKPGVPAGQTFCTMEWKQVRFWLHALEAIHCLAPRKGISISQEKQEEICAALSRKIPRPDEEDFQAHFKERLAHVRQCYKPEYFALYEAWYQQYGL